ncbi:hypothetical protein L6164_008004 [Bauhinia variegata]|uniref:Uncharacterized protein n=1 Tax=Bauhinia variegata TaxID=167791 RepID=A0ACB9PFN6_BAUVA|nr:hypothetical protein L6164_008004 [Bauhinia variegata]
MSAPQVPYHAQHAGEWTTGLCDCCEDPGNCCMAFCCPCITFGRNAEIIEGGRTTCCASGLIFFCLAQIGCAWIYSCTYRSKLRGLYSLPASPCSDCCVHFCCATCALCQEHRELKNRGLDPSIGWAGNVIRMNRGQNQVQTPPHFASGMAR